MTREQLQTMRLIANTQLELAARLKKTNKGNLPELELVTFWLNDVRRISERAAPSAATLQYAKSTLYRSIGRLSRIQSEAPPSLIKRLHEQVSRLAESWRAFHTALNPSRALTLWRAYR